MDLKQNNLSINDLKEIASLHSNYLNQGFLSSLGVEFLTLLYEAIDKDRESILLVERVENRVVGFVSGTNGLIRIYMKLLMKPLQLFFSLKDCLLSPRKLYKIFEIIFLSKKISTSTDLPKQELLSIVVNPNYQGAGHSEILFYKLCDHFKLNGMKSFKIIVGSNLNRAHAFYKKVGAIPLRSFQVHKGSESLIYIKKID